MLMMLSLIKLMLSLLYLQWNPDWTEAQVDQAAEGSQAAQNNQQEQIKQSPDHPPDIFL